MTSQQLNDCKINDVEESKQNIVNNNNKNLIIKFTALKNALIEEREKTSFLEKENKSLKEEIFKNNEIIVELKDELKKYHDTVDKKGNSNFFSELFNNLNISEIKNELIIEKLKNENFKLKEEIEIIKNKLNIMENQLKESLSKNDLQKKEYEQKIKLYEKEKEDNKKEYNNEKEKLNIKINEYYSSNRQLEEKVRLLGSDRIFLQENINKFKKEINHYKDVIKSKNEEIEKLFQEQENNINNNTEFKQKITNLKNIIDQYKKAIDNCTEITDDYIFIGKIIPNTHYNNTINIQNGNNINDDMFIKVENKINDINKTNIFKTIKLVFDFYKRKINIKIEDQKPVNIDVKNIIDIVHNLHVEGQIKLFYKIKDMVFDYLCQFTKKESEFIIYFYKELKNQDKIDPALFGLSMGTM
jgi:hypothetical protein